LIVNLALIFLCYRLQLSAVAVWHRNYHCNSVWRIDLSTSTT